MLTLIETERFLDTILTDPDYQWIRDSFKKDNKFHIILKLEEAADEMNMDPDSEDLEDAYNSLLKVLRKP